MGGQVMTKLMKCCLCVVCFLGMVMPIHSVKATTTWNSAVVKSGIYTGVLSQDKKEFMLHTIEVEKDTTKVSIPTTILGAKVTCLGNLLLGKDDDRDRGPVFVCKNAKKIKVSEVVIPETVTALGRKAFCGYESLKKVNIPSGVKVIPYAAFCSNGIKSIQLPKQLTWIGTSAFSDCKQLSYLNIPDGVTIGDKAFEYTGLSNVSIGSKVNLGKLCFANTKISTVKVSKDNDWILKEGAILSKDRTQLITAIKMDKAYVIPNSVKTVKDDALNGMNITSLTIPKTVRNVGKYAFSNNQKLKKVIIKGSPSMKAYTFFDCNALKTVEAKNIKKISSYMFGYCRKLNKIIWGRHLTQVGRYAFSNCNFKKIVLPAKLKKLGTGAFCDNKKLKAISIVKGNTSFSVSRNCLLTKSKRILVAIPSGKSFVVPKGCKFVSEDCFTNMKKVKRIA